MGKVKTADRRQVPANAFRFDAGRVQFAANDADNSVRIVARSGKPIVHWWWGKVVHDFAGMQVLGGKIALDWCHDDYEELGYADTFDISTGDLVITGELVPLRPDDRASTVLAKGRAGVPYEASIYFDAYNQLSVEEIGPDQVAEVNGREIAGPCVIFRKWMLRGVAVCLYGADPYTKTEMDDKGDQKMIAVTVFNEEAEMRKKAEEKAAEKPAEKNAVQLEPGANVAKSDDDAKQSIDRRAEFSTELKRFCEKFGAENGVKWFSDGKTFEEALALHCDVLQQALDAEKGGNAELRRQLEQIADGEAEPVNSSSGEADECNSVDPKLARSLPDGLARFASGLKLPTAPAAK